MKKLIMIALLAILTVSIYSCTKDEKSIEKTKWTYQDSDETEIIEFLDKSNMQINNTSDGTEVTVDGTYSYNAPSVTIKILGEVFNGVVDGDKLSLTDPEDQSVRVYTKN